MLQQPIKKFFVAGGFMDTDVALVMERAGMELTSFNEAELVVFTGGADVSPEYYGEKRIPGVACNPSRDTVEKAQFITARDAGKAFIGICRGAQLLHVLHGHKLWQDVNFHALGGAPHTTYDLVSGDVVMTTSCHHQMMRVDDVNDPKNDFKVVAISDRSTHRRAQDVTFRVAKDQIAFRNDIEVLWYPETNSLCYQGHPEFGNDKCRNYFYRLMKRYGYIS